jgi:hypothetical protein
LGTTLFVVPGGHYEAVLRNYEANNRVKKQIQGKTKVKNKNLKI